jgi:hypothetical protein
MCFAESGCIAQKEDVGLLVDEVQIKQMPDLRTVDLLRPAPLELVECFQEWKARHAHAPLDTLVVTVGDFALDETVDVLELASALLRGGLSQIVVMAADIRIAAGASTVWRAVR